MTAQPLTPAELAELERAAVAAKLDVHFAAVLDLIAEVRATRELLATPTTKPAPPAEARGSEMKTAENLTDREIEALRNEIAPMATPRPRCERTAEDLEIIDACDYALTPYPEYAEKRLVARERVAEILNTRQAKEQ